MYICTYTTPVGLIRISEEQGAITHITYNLDKPPTNSIEKPTALLEEAHRQLQEYFSGQRKIFDLPLAPCGTPFQQKIWAALQTIPYGQTASYKDIATKIGNPQACRAVGMANNKNPIAIVIPCHRVIGTNGKLVGYAGGLNVKEHLLSIEQ